MGTEAACSPDEGRVLRMLDAIEKRVEDYESTAETHPVGAEEAAEILRRHEEARR